MNAKVYLSRVGKEYKSVREARKRLGAEKDAGRREDLRQVLKTEAAYYTGILNEVWDLIEEMEEGLEREILLRRYVFLESWEQVAGDLGYKKVATVYGHHKKALSRVQRMLNGMEKGEVA